MDALKQSLNEMYDLGIQHAIDIVSDVYLGIEEDVISKGYSVNTVFVPMLNKLKKLKSVQPSDPPPIPDGIIPLK